MVLGLHKAEVDSVLKSMNSLALGKAGYVSNNRRGLSPVDGLTSI